MANHHFQPLKKNETYCSDFSCKFSFLIPNDKNYSKWCLSNLMQCQSPSLPLSRKLKPLLAVLPSLLASCETQQSL